MSRDLNREPMLDMFVFETLQLIEQLEQEVLRSEKSGCFESDAINEIFRIMHTIKGSSAMMLFNNIAVMAHSVEDLFYYLREVKPENIDYSNLTDIILECIDLIKIEIAKIQDGKDPDGDTKTFIEVIKIFLEDLKQSNPSSETPHKNVSDPQNQKYYISQYKAVTSTLNIYKAIIFFEDGCEMENIRAFTVIHNLNEIAQEIYFLPSDIVENDESADVIRNEGFKVWLKSDLTLEEVRSFLSQTLFLKHLEINKLENDREIQQLTGKKEIILDEQPLTHSNTEKQNKELDQESNSTTSKQSIISVSVSKLDKLMDLVGELVISQAMVTQNPELNGLPLDNFHKASRQLKKITDELQDIVMSIRMVPLSMTFQKMNRIVRDMCKKLQKEVGLEIIGEETEVDKNIIEHISDPLMHLIRNSLDHGIESANERIAAGKSEKGTIMLEAKHEGGDVLITIKDDGRGLDKEKILKKARENSLIHKPESELTDREIYSFIFLPGFSTKEKVTEFSGRGVGMDVVGKNIEKLGGMISVDSIPGKGTTVTVKIPLTLAIIDGMTVKVGNSRYTVPIICIKEAFKVQQGSIITDPDGNEMILIRGECYPVLRLHELYKVKTDITEIHDGIVVMVENESKTLCIFADELLGQQQVVVKTLPNYIKKVRGVAGCTLLGDGSISLILDITALLNY